MFHTYESDKWEVKEIIMAMAGILAAPFLILDFIIRFFYKFGANHFVLTILVIAICWFIFAKFLGLKGRECLYAPTYLGEVIQLILLVLLYFMFAGFIGYNILDYNSFNKLSSKEAWVIFGIFSFVIGAMFVLRHGHKPQDLMGLDELKEIKDNLEAENDKLRAKKEEKLREVVDEFIEEQKEKDISEIEKLKAENEALKKKLQEKI